MSTMYFGDATAQDATRQAIEAVEAQTSAEVVVALRPSSGRYREADYVAGALTAMASLCVMLFSSHVFPLRSFPVGVGMAFAAGAVLSARLTVLRRWLTPRAVLADNVARAARAAFVDLGISKTSGRWGVLVYVSVFERTVEVLPDVGCNPKSMGHPWVAAVDALKDALHPVPDVQRFLTALRALGPVLGAALPHRDDDVDELSDQVQS